MEVTRRKNIKYAQVIAKHAINLVVVALTNCYQTAVGQSLYLFVEISVLWQNTKMPYKHPMLQRLYLKSSSQMPFEKVFKQSFIQSLGQADV